MSSSDSRRQEVTEQMWYAAEDCTRSVQRRVEKLGRRRLRVGYGKQTVRETKRNADFFEILTLLDGKVCQRGMIVPGHKDICKPEQPACNLSATKLSASVNPTIARYSHVVGWSLIRWWTTLCWCRSVATFQASLWTVPVCAAIVVSWTTHRSPYQFWPGEQQLVVFLQLYWQALADSKQRRRTSHSYLVPGISLLVYFVISYL